MSDTTRDRIVEMVRECLALDADDLITTESLLFYELDFTSLDLLDLLYRIEQELGVHIAEGTLYELARGDMPDAAFCSDGVLTPAGRERLMELLHDSPREIFPEQIHADTLPRYCTVGSFVRLVDHRLATPAGDGELTPEKDGV